MVDQLRDLYEAASKGFHTSETCGPDGKYLHVIKFQNMTDLHAYEDAWRTVMVAVRDAAPEASGADYVLDRPARVAGRDFMPGEPVQRVVGRAHAHYDAHHANPAPPTGGTKPAECADGCPPLEAGIDVKEVKEIIAKYVGRTSRIYLYIANDLAKAHQATLCSPTEKVRSLFERCASTLVGAEYAQGYREALDHVDAARRARGES